MNAACFACQSVPERGNATTPELREPATGAPNCGGRHSPDAIALFVLQDELPTGTVRWVRTMAIQVVNGAQLTCWSSRSVQSGGASGQPGASGNQPAANIMDYIPNTNIMPFGMCQTPCNPQVAAATAAAMGVLNSQPCVPATAAPWMIGAPTVLINQPALDNQSKCMCTWLGVITITSPGQTTEEIP